MENDEINQLKNSLLEEEYDDPDFLDDVKKVEVIHQDDIEKSSKVSSLGKSKTFGVITLLLGVIFIVLDLLFMNYENYVTLYKPLSICILTLGLLSVFIGIGLLIIKNKSRFVIQNEDFDTNETIKTEIADPNQALSTNKSDTITEDESVPLAEEVETKVDESESNVGSADVEESENIPDLDFTQLPELKDFSLKKLALTFSQALESESLLAGNKENISLFINQMAYSRLLFVLGIEENQQKKFLSALVKAFSGRGKTFDFKDEQLSDGILSNPELTDFLSRVSDDTDSLVFVGIKGLNCQTIPQAFTQSISVVLKDKNNENSINVSGKEILVTRNVFFIVFVEKEAAYLSAPNYLLDFSINSNIPLQSLSQKSEFENEYRIISDDYFAWINKMAEDHHLAEEDWKCFDAFYKAVYGEDTRGLLSDRLSNMERYIGLCLNDENLDNVVDLLVSKTLIPCFVSENKELANDGRMLTILTESFSKFSDFHLSCLMVENCVSAIAAETILPEANKKDYVIEEDQSSGNSEKESINVNPENTSQVPNESQDYPITGEEDKAFDSNGVESTEDEKNETLVKPENENSDLENSISIPETESLSDNSVSDDTDEETEQVYETNPEVNQTNDETLSEDESQEETIPTDDAPTEADTNTEEVSQPHDVRDSLSNSLSDFFDDTTTDEEEK
ncbi:MAG: hypothetical protein WCR67_04560 [Bacilli bacterium]